MSTSNQTGQAAAAEADQVLSPDPNVILTNDPATLEKYGPPLTRVNIGQDLIVEFPAEETQREGWYSEHARQIVAVSPLYKLLKPKGSA